jgi:GTP-binding protein
VRLPVVAVVGRPNVGKSTLFNRLIGSRKAIVRDTPGVTRDRIHGTCEFGGWKATIVDTGGLDPSSEEPLAAQVRKQVLAAIAEADALVFVVDGREGLTPLDEEVGRLLRRVAKPVLVAVNKVDAHGNEAAAAEAYGLGMDPVLPVSAEHGRGVAELIEALAMRLPAPPGGAAEEAGPLRIAVVGRPNVGKSSLVNAIAGQDRVVVHAEPGTTRDAVDTLVTVGERPYVLVDTAGLRRKGRTVGALDKLAAVMARRSLERADLALVVLDGSEGVTTQDARIAGYAEAAGRAVVLVVNKWDLVGAADRAPELVRTLRERLPFLAHAPVVFTSAYRGSGIRELFDTIDRVALDYAKEVSTGELNRALTAAVTRRPPAGVHGKTLKIFYGTQTGTRPPTFLLFVNDPAALHFSYERYLVNALRERFGFAGCAVRLRLRRRRPSRSHLPT